MADNLATLLCRMCGNLRASTYWSPQGLSRPVMELFELPMKNESIKLKKIKDGESPALFYTKGAEFLF